MTHFSILSPIASTDLLLQLAETRDEANMLKKFTYYFILHCSLCTPIIPTKYPIILTNVSNYSCYYLRYYLFNIDKFDHTVVCKATHTYSNINSWTQWTVNSYVLLNWNISDASV